jgi:hypothetical protein
MSLFFPNVDPAYIYKRKGDSTDPYIPLTQTAQVVNGLVTLKEIPEAASKVTVTKADGTVLTEVTTQTLSTNQYRVDYSTGVVYLHSSVEGNNLTFSFKGTGYVSFPANRLWLDNNKTLQQMFTEIDNIKINWLVAVNTFADLATTYPNPNLGDTVQTINDSKIYRYNGSAWVYIQQYSANAITDVQDKINQFKIYTNTTTPSESYAKYWLNDSKLKYKDGNGTWQSVAPTQKEFDDYKTSNDQNFTNVTKQISGITNFKQYNIIGDGITGNSNSIQAMIDTVRQNTITNGLTSFYTVEIPSGTYIIDKEIKMSPYIKLKSNGIVIFKLTFNGTAFWIAPSSSDPIYENNDIFKSVHLRKNFWNRGDYFDGSNGGFVFITSLDKNTTGNNTVAIEFGDRDSTSNQALPVSRYTIQNVSVFGLDTGFKWNQVNHYIGTYKNCFLELNNKAVNCVSLSGGNPLNSGENFNFENCIFAGHTNAFLLGCAGLDLTFSKCSFDFNQSPVFRTLYSGISIRIDGGYTEKIGNGLGNQLFLQSENTLAGTDNRRSSFYMRNHIMFLKRPSKLINNVANSDSKFINLFVDLDIEFRSEDIEVASPYNLADRYLLDTDQNITIMRHRVAGVSLIKPLVSKELNLLSNGDFERSILTSDLYLSSNDLHWVVDYKLNVSNPIITSDGVNGNNCLKWTINTAGNNSVRLTSLVDFRVESGEQLRFSTLYKTDKIDNNSQFIYRFEYYDRKGILISTINYYDYPTANTGIQTIDGTNYRLPRSVAVSQAPAGAYTVKPILIIANQQGSTFAVDEIHFSKSK